ncbi:MAG TPA: hypothetical protein VM183_16970 [Burkholderiales bacterium]|nr:hypothetical protein [Burkholderiales bacterium]
MHCELLIPGLFATPPATRLPALELLLARGRCTGAASQHLEAWLRDAFGAGERTLPAGAITLLATGADPGADCWSRADPVDLRLMRDRVILVPGAALHIQTEEAQALCESLNQHFAGRMEVRVVDAQRWVARFAQEVEIEADAPLQLAGRDVALARAAGAGASFSHQVMNEAQMVLHSHAVNTAREARGEPSINSVWLWGAGRKPKIETDRWHSVNADDPVALGLARAAGIRHRPLSPSAQSFLERMPEEGRHLIVLDQLRIPLALGAAGEYQDAISALERDWCAPLLQALRDGRVGMLTLHVPDAAECATYEAIRGDLRRFWRRPKPLGAYG